MKDTEEQLKDLLEQITPIPPDFDGNSDLIEDLALESIQVMEFVMEAEDHFDIAIAQDKLADVRTLSQLVAVIEDLRGAA